MSTGSYKAEIIAVEGLDGVGKSTTVQALVAMTSGVDVTRAIAAEMGNSRETILMSNSVEARYNYWLAVNYLAGERAAAHVSDGRVAIIDSYFFRTIVCHQVLGVAIDSASILAAATRPDRAVLLTVAEEIRLARLRIRDSNGIEPEWHVSLSDHHEQVLAGYRRFHLMEIDTSVPPHRISELILQGNAAEQFSFSPSG